MPLSQYIESRQLSADFVRSLEKYPRDELGQLIASLEPSANSLKSLLSLANEIALRDNISLGKVFSTSTLQQILASENISRKQRTKLYRDELEKMRYPELAKIKELLHGHCRKLSADTNLSIELPADLEGDSLVVSFKVRSEKEFGEFSKRLEKASSHLSAKEIFSLLRGDY